MRKETIKIIIQQAREAWITGNAGAFASLFVPDGEFIVPGSHWRGQAEIRQATAEFVAAYTDIKIEIRRIISDTEQAVVEWYWEDTKKATGKRNRADDAIVIDFESGLIRRWREYIDAQSPPTGN